MNILAALKDRFRPALAALVDEPAELLELVRPAQNAQFGDYQANFAMPLGKRLGRPPRDVATEIVADFDPSPMCEPPEVAGPGFINLRLTNAVAGRTARAGTSRPAAGLSPASPIR